MKSINMHYNMNENKREIQRIWGRRNQLTPAGLWHLGTATSDIDDTITTKPACSSNVDFELTHFG